MDVCESSHNLINHQLFLQATTSGLRLMGIQRLYGKGCLTEWHPPSGRGVSCLNSCGYTIVVASGLDLYVLQVTGSDENPVFTQIS